MIHDGPGSANAVRPDLKIGVHWTGGLRFSAGPEGRTTLNIDGNSRNDPSPPETLVCALATCVAVDVVLILEKRRTPVLSLDMDVVAERAKDAPRRLLKVHLSYRIRGPGIEREHALKAIELAVTKYCTVRDTLDPEMPVTWSLDLG